MPRLEGIDHDHRTDPVGVEASRRRRRLAELDELADRHRRRMFAVDVVVGCALLLYVVYLGAGGPAWPH